MGKSAVRDLTSGSPMRLILGFMLPLLLGMLFQQFYNMVDTIVVGRYLGVDALAGVGSTGSINFLVMGFVIGVSAGFAIPVAQKFGSRDEDALRKYVGNTLWLAAALAAVLTTATCLLCSNILHLMNTPDKVFSEAYDYIFVIFLGIPVTFLYNILSGIIRSLGDSKTPVIFLVISSILNIILDIFMIVALKMGVSGAGWATVISQLVSGLMCLIFIVKRFEILKLKKDDLKPDPYYIGRLCASGLPMGLQYSITAIGSILLQTAVNGLGPSYMAAVTAGSKVSQLMCCPVDAMGSTMATYGGQNVGAGKIERVKKGLQACSLLGVIWAVLAFGIVALFGGNLAMMFVDKNDAQSAEAISEIISHAHQFLVSNGAFYLLLAFVNIVRFLIQGMGFSQVAVYSGVFELVARGAFGLWVVPLFGYNAVCFANPTAWILADMFLFPTYFACYKRLKRRTK
ncbi:MAG: MATE family efflux transporter [Lachnospiraceae bacterium]|nr:MATE family efflux transporter [Ruminococcus sp.]MCM1275917.1 MATE family efflux transporter [Lachnospiraceae bacterium]